MPKVYGYLRVSHKDQSDNTFDTQTREIKARFKRISEDEPDCVWGETIIDKAVSAYKNPFFKRPGGARLNAMLKKGDIVVFSRVDRAFRNLLDLWRTVEHWKSRGVRFIFCDMPFDTSTAMGEAFLSFLGTFAQLDSAMKSERIKAGLRSKKEKGHVFGTTPKGFRKVYSMAMKHHLFIEELEARRIYNFMVPLRESGMGFARISDELEDWLAGRENRKSHRGTRSRYEYPKHIIEELYRRISESDRLADDSVSQSGQ